MGQNRAFSPRATLDKDSGAPCAEGGAGRHSVWRLMPLCSACRAPAPYPDPLEPKREVCELNPDCDELADHIGFQEAYRRFYGLA